MFKEQVIWITGASSGIGEALAVAFSKEGAKLVLSARRKAELERVARHCTDAGAMAVLVVPLDITDHEAMPAAVDRVLSDFGRIDMLINNAGISQRSKCIDTDMAVYRTMMEVDVLGQIAMTKAVLPVMLKQGSGHLAVTSSVAGKIGVALRTGYCAAKHAMMGFFDALRAETASAGLKVSTITPGYIKTSVSINALNGDGSSFGQTDKDIANGMDVTRCAQVILDGLRKGTPEIAVGEGMEMKALLLKRLFPKLVFKKVAGLASDHDA